ncbi:hypothetical protein D3C76_867460 [compost metagenome]
MQLFAHQHVNATVVVIHRIKRRDTVFLGPVGFEVGEGLVIETADQGQAVGVGLKLVQVLAVLLQAPALLPEVQHPRVVLPAIETLQVLVDFQGAQRDPGTQARIEAPIHFATRLWRTPRVSLAVADLHLLRIDARQGLAKPGLGQLPEQAALTQVLALHLRGDQQTAVQGFLRRLMQLPGQALAAGITGEQPVANSPQGLLHTVAGMLFKLDLQSFAALQAHTHQRAAFEHQAQVAITFIGAEAAPARQGQSRRSRIEWHDRGSQGNDRLTLVNVASPGKFSRPWGC